MTAGAKPGDSESPFTAVIIQGQIVIGGAPTAGQLLLMAEPGDGVLSKLPPQSPVKTTPVADQVVDATGEFALTADPGVPLGAIGDDGPNGKLITFQLVAQPLQGGDPTIFIFSRYLQMGAAGPSWVDPVGSMHQRNPQVPRSGLPATRRSRSVAAT
jgi:hypothetical protein